MLLLMQWSGEPDLIVNYIFNQCLDDLAWSRKPRCVTDNICFPDLRNHSPHKFLQKIGLV